MSTSYRFTTATRLQRRLSQAGVNLRIDDDTSNATDDCIMDATVEILSYTQLLYDTDSLASSSIIEHKCRDIAAWYICTRRGNPAPKPIEHAYERALDWLEKVQAGRIVIADAAQRKNQVPVLTNQRVATYPFPRVVNVEGTSTGTREHYIPHTDRTDGMDYSI